METTQLRVLQNTELRTAGPGIVEGLAAVFNEPSLPVTDGRHSSFEEVIRKGAFSRSLAENDIRALFSHDDSKILGRTKAGTLSLRETDVGLHAKISMPDTTLGRDVYQSVKRGDISGMSFAFTTRKDNWLSSSRRELLDIDCREISLVAWPAYPTTTAEARSVGLPETYEVLSYRGVSSLPVTDEERERLRLRLSLLRRL